jgi:NADP-dependent 3-hydroxy acid dehydrogenase YdfG
VVPDQTRGEDLSMLAERYRTAAVTGASRGIGAAIVRALRVAGIEVHALARSVDALQALAAETGCIAHRVDIDDRAAAETCLAGRAVDIIVCNAAALGPPQAVFEASPPAIQETLRTNIEGVLNCLAATVPGMRRRGKGHVVVISSTAALQTLPGMPLYAMTKAALHTMIGGLRLDLHGSGVRVTEIAPGRVRTGIHLDMMSDRAAAQQRFYDGFECLEADDIADAVLYVLRAPQRVDVTLMEILPTDQSYGGSQFHRRG